MTDTVPVPRDAFLDHVVALAREVGEIQDYTSPPERGVEGEVDWDWPDDWDIEYVEDDVCNLYGSTEGEYQVQTARAVTNAPPSKCHPAEYEWRTVPVAVTITLTFGEGSDLELAAPWVRVEVL